MPKAMGQEDAAPVPVVIEDAADDVKLVAAGQPPQDATATGQADDVDIRSVTFDGETEKDFTITLKMKTLPAQGASTTLFRAVYFELDGLKYRIVIGGRGQGQQGGQASLQSYDEGVQRYRSVGSLPTQQEASAAKIVFTVPRELVTNKQHVPIRHGDHLMNLYASATKFIAGLQFLPTGDPTGGASLLDRAPNAGYGAHFLFVKGRVGSGDLMLVAPDPVRVSNGEATTIVYKIEAMNHGDAEESFQLEALEAQAEWSVRVPSVLRVGPGESVVFPVILSLPDSHEHGRTALFELKATSLQDKESWSSVRLGVFWTETPQPAGHHPGMWLHSSPGDFEADPAGVFPTVFPFRSVWINPLDVEVDPDADDANVPAFFNNEIGGALFNAFPPGSGASPPGGTTWTTEWFLPLAPALLIGLDFDLERQGQLDVKVVHALPAQQATVTAQLLYCDPEKATSGRNNGNCTTGFINERWTPIAEGVSAPASATASETVGYNIPLAIDPAADLLPYKHGANIGLRILLTTNVPANTIGLPPRPELVIKWSGDEAPLRLPLIEYHDPIDQAFQAVGNFALKSLVPFEKKVNPGRTTVFRFLLENQGADAEEVQLEVHGEGDEWARLSGDAKFKVGPRSSRDVELAVTIPANVAEGSRAELFLVAQSLRDPAVVAAIRLRATVVQSEDIPDEAAGAAQGSSSKTPGVVWVEGLLLAVGVAGLLRRRRR